MSVAESVDARTFTLVQVDDAVGPDDEHRAAAGGNLCRVGIDFRVSAGSPLGTQGFQKWTQLTFSPFLMWPPRALTCLGENHQGDSKPAWLSMNTFRPR